MVWVSIPTGSIQGGLVSIEQAVFRVVRVRWFEALEQAAFGVVWLAWNRQRSGCYCKH